MSRLILLVLVTAALCRVASSTCTECCTSRPANCSQAFQQTPGICCGTIASKSFCCPTNTYCLPSNGGSSFQCTRTPPNGCDICCGGGSCSRAYSNGAGKCCGTKGVTAFCCPASDDAVCVEESVTFSCSERAGSEHGGSGFPIVGAIVITIIALLICGLFCYCMRRRGAFQFEEGVVMTSQAPVIGTTAMMPPPPYGANPVVVGAPAYGYPVGYNSGYSGAAVVGAGVAGLATGVLIGNAMGGGYDHHHHYHDYSSSNYDSSSSFAAQEGNVSGNTFAADSSSSFDSGGGGDFSAGFD